MNKKIKPMNNKHILDKEYPYLAFVDVEMSNTSQGCKGQKEGQMLSMSAVIADGEGPDFEIVNRFTGYMRPAYFDNWSKHSAKYIHKISIEEAMTFPPCKKTLIAFLNFMLPYKNEDNSPIPFFFHGQYSLDYKLLRMVYRQLGLQGSIDKLFDVFHTISTYEMFVDYKENNNVKTANAQLSTMAEAFDIKLDHHEVESDTLACYEGFKSMWGKLS